MPPDAWEKWRLAAAGTVPIIGVTAGLDLAGLDLADIHPAVAAPDRARLELESLARAAAAVGAGWVRLLARHPLTTPVPALVDLAVPVVVELHHPAWWQAAPHRVLLDLLDTDPSMGVLADTAQLTHARTVHSAGMEKRWGAVADRVRVLHLSDNGTETTTGGHEQAARDLAARIHTGQPVEVAVEWTGADRSRAVCLDRHRSLTRWWRTLCKQETPRP
ncbi:hypothetical protein [Nocardiopsis synnemataformans]|uniref:hypothetical protein n=1 Tax=Nocardiopsis synnemataformans TaxID=61305 RepID=UPI003EBD3671